jgi:hypothetical protein
MSSDHNKPGERSPEPTNTPSAKERRKPKPWLHQPKLGETDKRGRVVAVGLLTQEHLDMLGNSLKKVYRIDETPCFPELLEAIDRADREHWRADDREKVVERLNRCQKRD